MFRRRRSEETDDLEEGFEDELDDDVEEEPAPLARPQGPWDVADAAEGVERLDFGALQLPVREGHELRVDVDPATQGVVALTLAGASSVMQVMVFAAPKTTGIWVDVRREIADSLTGSGGSVEEVTGPYGPELLAQIPGDQPGQSVPARFLGVDGPRWFLRAMVQGRAAVDATADPDLIAAFADIVVDRGGDAMAVRDPLPLRLPKDVQQQVAEHAQAEAEGQAAGQKPSLDLLERGPEITETR